MDTFDDKQYRQGDVLLWRRPSIPADAKQEKVDGKAILAEGEATGHHHAVLDPTIEVFTIGEGVDLTKFIRTPTTVEETHQEHGTITVPPSEYQVIRQREYEPEAPRYVCD